MKTIKPGIYILLAVFICLSIPKANSQIVDGEASCKYTVRVSSAFENFTDYENNGFRQSVFRKDDTLIVNVEIDSSPINSRSPFPVPHSRLPDDIKGYTKTNRESATPERLKTRVKSLTSKGLSQYEVVRNILLWVSENIEYSYQSWQKNDAISVFKRKRGYCRGRVNLTVLMLREAGIPVRKAHSLSLNGIETEKVQFGRRFLHRWLEVYYPDKGWVFSDPGRYINTVDTGYIVFSEPGSITLDDLENIQIQRKDYRDNLVVSDIYSKGDTDLTLRGNGGTRYRRSLVGTFVGFSRNTLKTGKVILHPHGSSIALTKSLNGNRSFAFTPLPSAVKYTLKVKLEGGAEKLYTFESKEKSMTFLKIKSTHNYGT